MRAAQFLFFAVACSFGPLIAASSAFAEGILIVPGDDEEAEEQILVEPHDEREEADDQVAPAPGAPVYPRSAPIVEEGMRVPPGPEEELERPGERQRELEGGGERQQDLELPDGPGIKY